jgi:anti-anti-sigma factor
MLDELLDGSVSSVVVDLRATSFIDSTGLGVLVGAARKARSQDGQLTLDSPTRSVHRVLQITGLTLSIPVRNAPEDGTEIPDADPKDLTPA